MRSLRPLLIFSIFLSTIAYSQCGPYKGHPIFPDSLGYAFINLNECGAQLTSCLWDNGSVDLQAQDLSIGMHSVVLFVGNDPVDTLYFEIEQLLWQMNQTVLPMGGAMSVTLWAELNYCGTQIFNYHKCTPDPDSTVIYLLQDGIAIDSVMQVSCPVQLEMWSDLPFGYTYQTYLVDHGSCGSYAYGDLVTTWSCAGAAFDIIVEPATDGNGSIEVIEVIPDPNDLSPPAPLTGTFMLFDLPDQDLVGLPQSGTGALWVNLPAGEYQVIFAADSLCDPVIMDVTIDVSTGIHAMAPNEDGVLWPVPVRDVLYWNGGTRTFISVTDVHGRVVLEGNHQGQMDVSTLQPGIYFLRFGNGVPRTFVKE